MRSVESHMELDCESEVDVDVSSVRSRRTAFTRSLAIRDHDSRRLCASQHGPIPLIFTHSVTHTLLAWQSSRGGSRERLLERRIIHELDEEEAEEEEQ